MPENETLLQALSMSIMLSTNTRCNGGCKSCISRTTPNCVSADSKTIQTCDFDRLKVGWGYAQHLRATHAILTGKADPLQEDADYLREVIAGSRKYMPLVDIHTNGFGFGRKQSVRSLQKSGLTNITFSIASFYQEDNAEFMGIKELPLQAIAEAVALKMYVRCSLLLTAETIYDFHGIMDYIMTAGEMGVNAVVIREIWRPDRMLGESNEVYEYNRANFVSIGEPEKAFDLASQSHNMYGISKRKPLPWGQPVFTVSGVFKNSDHGVNVTFARCNEGETGSIIKSIVHKPDGHGYSAWDDPGTILY